MRVIAGEFGGRTLKSTQTAMLRPTTDRVRESIFNILAARIEFEGATVLDLYAGTGALGIEALSRGAAQCTFVENDPRAAAVINDNLRTLGAESRAAVSRRDALKFLAGADAAYDLILADPPYASPVFDRLAADVFALGRLKDGGHLVIEHSSALRIDAPPGAVCALTRSFGDSAITILTHGH